MENKKLVKILIHDMADLEELIGDMKAKQKFDALEMEFIHTRAKGVLQLLQMLDAQKEAVVDETGDEKRILEKLKDKVEKVSKITSEIIPEKIMHEEPAPDRSHEEKEQQLPGVVPEPSHPSEDDSSPSQEGIINDDIVVKAADEDMLQDEVADASPSSRLGDSFLKSKSLGELINEQVKLDYKLSNRPVSSIQSSIGINDRFQYIRELFDGDNRKFVDAVKTLDSMSNIKDAVEYLRDNYKWKKNETSLKFVNLVKRRFQDKANG